MAPGRFLLFGAQFSPGVYFLLVGGYDGVLWCGTRFLPSNLGIKTKIEKKDLRRKIFRYCMAITQFKLLFCSRKKLYSLLGGTSSDLGGITLKCQPVALGLLLSFGTRSCLVGEAHFSLEGAQAVILGGTTSKCSRGTRLA